MTIHEKLSKIQKEFKAKKSRFNSFGKYNFRSAEDILEALKPYNEKYNVYFKVDETYLGDAIIESTATIVDAEGAMEITASAIVGVDLNQKGMQVPQQYGSASSYGKKYALGNLFLIDDTQDSDATNTHGKDKLKDIDKAVSYIKSGGTIDAIKKKYKLTSDQEKQLTTLNG